jgi:hypothetical protein
VRILKSASRGQALAESLLFFPVLLLLLFGTIYVSKYGVLSERTQLAVRYGGLVGNSSIYSVATIYNFLSLPNGSLPTCPSPPPGIVTDDTPLPGPVSAPYWQPVSVTTSCVGIAHSVGGAQFIASHIYAASQNTVSTQLKVPEYLQNVVGTNLCAIVAGACVVVSASEPFAHPADPSAILYCSQEVHDRVKDAVFGALLPPTPNPSPTPISTSSPAPLTFNC